MHDKDDEWDMERLVEEGIERHRKETDCDCPSLCPACRNGTLTYDVGLEGHICNKCDYYDGVK